MYTEKFSRVYDNLEKSFPNMKIIHEYCPMLDPTFWILGVKFVQSWFLTFKIAQGQIQKHGMISV